MSKKNKLILFIAIIFFITVFVATFLKKPRLFDNLFILETPSEHVDIYGNNKVGQLIVPGYPNLCKLGFFIFMDQNQQNKSDLILHIKSSKDAKQDMLKLTANGASLYNQRYPFKLPPLNTKQGAIYFFEFEPLKYKVGEALYFYLESFDSNQDNPIKIGCWNNIYMRGNAGGPSYFNEAPWQKYLVFHDYYLFDQNHSKVIKTIKYRMFLDPVFTYSYLGLCFLLITGIVFISYKERGLK